jgi:hypothetical protein
MEEATVVVGTRARRRGIQLFSRTNPITGNGLEMRPPVWDQPAVDALPEFFAGGGSAQAKLFVDPDGTEDHCLSLLWLKLGSNYQLPRHSHTGDCLYYVVAGEVHLGNRTISAGEGFFAPSEAPYAYTAGPEGAEVLEFRSTGRPIESQIHESPTGWKRILKGVRVNSGRWAQEFEPYSRWCRRASSVDYTTTTGERRSLAITSRR